MFLDRVTIVAAILAIALSIGFSPPLPLFSSHLVFLPWRSWNNDLTIPEADQYMKITFRQSGGYAGLTMGCEIDTDSLPAREAAKLQSLVKNSGILQAQSARTANAADLFEYHFAIETSEGTHRVSFDDLSLPESIAPLLEYLQDLARPIR